MSIPDKCGGCEHTIIRFENVHKGWCRNISTISGKNWELRRNNK